MSEGPHKVEAHLPLKLEHAAFHFHPILDFVWIFSDTTLKLMRFSHRLVLFTVSVHIITLISVKVLGLMLLHRGFIRTSQSYVTIKLLQQAARTTPLPPPTPPTLMSESRSMSSPSPPPPFPPLSPHNSATKKPALLCGGQPDTISI